MLLDYWPLNRWQTALAGQGKGIHSVAGLIGEKIPFILLTIASSIVTFWAQSKDELVSSIDNLPFFERFNNAVISYSAYLGKILWPANLAIYYPYELSLPFWKVLISGVIIIFITFAVVYRIKKLPFLFVGWFIYVGTLIPVIGLLQVGSQSMADRYTYLPIVGIAIGLAWTIPLFYPDKESRKKILPPLSMAVIVLFSFLTWNQCRYWKDSKTIFRHALRVTHNNHLAHNNLGSSLFKEGRINEAFYHFNKAISIVPNLHGYYTNRGNAYVNLGQPQLAIHDYTKAISLKQNYADGYYNRGTLYGKIGQYNPALEDLNKTIALKPDHFKAFNNRGIVYNQMGSYEKALDDFNEAILIKPDYADAFNNRAFLYFTMKNPESGCNDLRKSCQLGNCAKFKEAENEGLCR
jgi:tetratricopeptide (TPR) repeat protein